MDDVLRWGLPIRRSDDDSQAEAQPGTTARFGGDDDGPALVGIVEGPMQIGMAREALAEAKIPAYIKQESVGPIYGLSIGEFGRAEVWAPAPLVEQARDLLIGIGVLRDEG
jgi:hypothetical protein